jgi:DNA-binding transcriptional LysR family regulator
MRDALGDLAMFVAAVRAGGIRAAAARLAVPRSTVSRRISALERRLGVRLLQRTRTRTGFLLTDVAQDCFDRVAAIVDSAEAVAAELSGASVQARGTLRVAASSLFADEFLAPIIERYTRAHPDVAVELDLAIDRIDLRANRIDVAFRTAPLGDDDDFTAVRLGDSVNGFFASPAYLRDHPRPQHPRQLSEHSLIAVGEPSKKVIWRYTERNRERAITVRPRVLAGSFELVKNVCVAAVGISRLPAFLACDLVQDGRLAPILEPYWHNSSVHAVFPRGIAAGLKTRAFVELARTLVTAQLRAKSADRCQRPGVSGDQPRQRRAVAAAPRARR